jgi:hypothetical protein
MQTVLCLNVEAEMLAIAFSGLKRRTENWCYRERRSNEFIPSELLSIKWILLLVILWFSGQVCPLFR